MKKIQMKRIQKLGSEKLRLSQETVRRLHGSELEHVVGGFHPTPSIDCSGYIFC
jgi:hypothetical protein